MSNDSNDKKALIALMDLVLALADYATTPPGHRNKVIFEVRAKQREAAGWRETLHLLGTEANRKEREDSVWQARQLEALYPGRQERATRPQGHGAVAADGQAAKTAVAATERRMRAWQGLADMRVNVVQQGSGESWAHQEPIEADDSRITDGHKCCGGKPDCGCARSVGG